MLMRFQLPPQIRSLLKATKFWQDNDLLLRQFKHFRGLAILAVASTLLGAALEGVMVGLIASFLQGLTNPNEPPIQTGIEWFDIWVLATQASAARRVYQLSALIFVAIWLRSGLKYVGQLFSRLCGLNLGKRLRMLIFEQLQSLSLSYYSQTRSGELINSVTSEVNQVQQAFNVVSKFMTSGSTLLAYVIAMFWISWPLSIVAVMLLSLLSVGLSTLIGKVREASFELPKANGRFASVAIEFINGIRVVKGSGTQDFERRRMYGAIEGILKVNYKVTAMSA
ncbi:MAG: ABC transporter ATP-binding protein, partial [Cyanobacteria bacterium QS_3_48_167]